MEHKARFLEKKKMLEENKFKLNLEWYISKNIV